MDFRFSHFEILTSAGAVFLGLLFLAVFTTATAIEQDLSTQAKAAVAEQNLFWVSAAASGQEVVLSGAAPDFRAKRAAAEQVADIPGVVNVVNEIAVIGEAGTCQKQFDEFLSKEEVTFKSGRADISDSSVPLLNMLASVARACGAKVEIAGHTDSRGDAAVNLKLSQRRADAVAKYLVQSGVASRQVQAVGYGEQQPVADNETEQGRDANRRIEFRVIGDSA